MATDNCLVLNILQNIFFCCSTEESKSYGLGYSELYDSIIEIFNFFSFFLILCFSRIVLGTSPGHGECSWMLNDVWDPMETWVLNGTTCGHRSPILTSALVLKLFFSRLHYDVCINQNNLVLLILQRLCSRHDSSESLVEESVLSNKMHHFHLLNHKNHTV